jgi:peptide/nickel transport system permease protein
VLLFLFFSFPGFWRSITSHNGTDRDAATQANIRKELYLDQPKWKQFFYYVNDVSPISIHSSTDIKEKKLRGFFIGGKKK